MAEGSLLEQYAAQRQLVHQAAEALRGRVAHEAARVQEAYRQCAANPHFQTLLQHWTLRYLVTVEVPKAEWEIAVWFGKKQMLAEIGQELTQAGAVLPDVKEGR